MRFCKDHIEINDSYAKCMTIAQYPQQLDDKFIATLLQQVPYIVLSIAIQPVETEDAYREIEDSRMKTDAEKVQFNRKTVENLDFVATVPSRTPIRYLGTSTPTAPTGTDRRKSPDRTERYLLTGQPWKNI